MLKSIDRPCFEINLSLFSARLFSIFEIFMFLLEMTSQSVYARSVVPKDVENYYWVAAAVFLRDHLEIPAVISILYLLAIFVGPRLMASRERLNVKPLAIFWNGALALFSILGVHFYAVKVFLPAIQEHGLSFELCTVHSEYVTPWVFFFILSKIPELFDTVIHVMKKQSFIFLHWYHHVTVMWFCWFAWAYHIENGGAFASMNLLVHSIMYTFYTLGSAGVRFPTLVMVSITSLQIIQMVLGTAIVSHNLLYCNHNPYIQTGGLLMYLSYGALFIHFFVSKYFGRDTPTKPHGKGSISNGNGHAKAN